MDNILASTLQVHVNKLYVCSFGDLHPTAVPVALQASFCCAWAGSQVRDGRDMAFSSNKNQLGAVGQHFVSNDEFPRTELGVALRRAVFWSRVNRQTYTFALNHLGPSQYHLARIEDFVRVSPDEAISAASTLAVRLGLGVGALNINPSVIEDSFEINFRPQVLNSGYGKWKSMDPAVISAIAQHPEVNETLVLFGYA